MCVRRASRIHHRRGTTRRNGNSVAAASGALKHDVFALLHEAAEYSVTIQFQDAKLEVARVGTGIINPGEYDKNGRSPQWTANLRKPKPLLRSDLLRQLVPGPRSASSSPAANGDPSAVIESATTVHDPNPNRLQIPDDYSIEDANADLFG